MFIRNFNIIKDATFRKNLNTEFSAEAYYLIYQTQVMKVQKWVIKSNIFLSALFFLFVPKEMFAQIFTSLSFDPDCVTSYQSSCPYFRRLCPTSWATSHGSPNIVLYDPPHALYTSYGQLISDGVNGEGMFIPFNFIPNQTYSISLIASGIGSGTANLNVVLTKGLVETSKTVCQDAPPTVTIKKIFQPFVISSSTQLQTFNTGSFTIGSSESYSQVWIYVTALNKPQIAVQIPDEIRINELCSMSAPTSLTTTNSTGTLTWNAPSGAPNGTTYNVAVQDTYNGNSRVSIYRNVNGITKDYCPQGQGASVSFNVQTVCPNGGYGATSSNYTFTSVFPYMSIPSQLSAIPVSSTSEQLSWAAQPAGISYYVNYYGPTTGGFVTSANSYTLTGLTPNSNYTYTISAYSVCGVTTAANGAFTTQSPAACITPTGLSFSAVSSSLILYWNAVYGAANYDVQYTAYPHVGNPVSGTISTINNSYVFTYATAPKGSTVVASVRAHCSNGMTSAWSNSYNGTINSVGKGQSESAQSTLESPSSPTSPMSANSERLKIYPIPSKSNLNVEIFSNTQSQGDIIVMSQTGIVMLKQELHLHSGINKFVFDIHELITGFYIIKIKDPDGTMVRKFLVQH